MGSPSNEVDRYPNEGPQTLVTVAGGFWIGRYEVTQREFLGIMGYDPSLAFDDLDRPVEQVPWGEARRYCQQFTSKLSIPKGYEYRLPTEAEWELAARAGTTTRFSFGDDIGYSQLADHAWYGGLGGNFELDVGGKLPNPWGLYDMNGNVWEWCLDWYDKYPGGSVVDPTGPGVGVLKVARGGAYWSNARDCRSATRLAAPPGGNSNVGFRIVLGRSLGT
jgi:formylglycine-generating enzyme required for sulfatase activity